jgi:LEA14-like dessication related protein
MDQGKSMNDTRRRQFAFAGLLAAAVIVATFTGCAGVPPGMQPPTITIADFGLGDAGLFEQRYNLRLRIQNPNPDDFKVDGIAFDLDINGQPFAKGVGNQTITVPRYGSGFIAVEAVSTLGGLLKQFGRPHEGNRTLFKYRIKGQLSIAGGPRVPFEENGEFDFGALVPKGLTQR